MVRVVAVIILCLAYGLPAAPPVKAGTDADVLSRSLKDGGVARIDRLLDDGSLALSDGRTARLVGVRIPDDGQWRRAATATVANVAKDRPVHLWFDDRAEDRYGHLLAHVVTGDGAWLEAALIDRGLAQVESRRDDHAMVQELLLRETKARNTGAGLWSDPRYKVVSAEEIANAPKGRVNRFGIVEGQVTDISDSANWTFVNFGADWHTDFTIAVAAGDRRALRSGGLDLAALAGRRVRVRGWIRDWNGPLIEVDHAEQIEILAAPSAIAEREIHR